MGKIYLVRHGQTESNVNKKFQGLTDVPLNAIGLEQAEKVGKHLSQYSFAKIYSSPLTRAKTTAEAISKASGINIEVIDELKEFCFGEWEGLTWEEINERDPQDLEKFQHCPVECNIPGGESLEQVRVRSEFALNKILKEHPHGDVVIVAHGGTIRVMMAVLLGIDLNVFWKINIFNASTTTFSVMGRDLVLDYSNEDYYLK